MFNDYKRCLPELVDDVLVKNDYFGDKRFGEHLKKLVEHNVVGGKKMSTLTLVHLYEDFEDPKRLTEENLRKAYMLSWCIEILIGALILVDDVADGGETRRGKTCWHLLPEVGTGLSTDAFIILNLGYQILDLNFAKEPHYAEIIQQYNKISSVQFMGQHLDNTLGLKVNGVEEFTDKTYDLKVKNKVFPIVQLCFNYAMILSNKYNEERNNQLHDIGFEVAKLYHIQNDYIDCYSYAELTGKRELSTDIPAGTCNWLAIKALQRCNAEQRAEFIKYYGTKDLEHVKRILQLYDDLRLPELYEETKNALANSLRRKFEQLPEGFSPEPFLNLLNLILKEDYIRFIKMDRE